MEKNILLKTFLVLGLTITTEGEHGDFPLHLQSYKN